MNLTQIKEKAKTMGIKPGKLKKAELIQTIQLQENNTPCYGTSNGACDQENCLWRKDCLAIIS